MYTSKEKEIIERCFAVSIWNYRASKSAIAGKEIEASAFRDRTRRELIILEKLIDELSPPVLLQPQIKLDAQVPARGLKISKFLGRLIGRDL